ncbi:MULTISPECIES: flagellar hook protein FlgE [Thioalkalivibrio]|uniref:Flagellar hook protein FlgE n=1 Tax=Thioalkalivibrio versutus TaxID=106634 RepID=A0A0G3G8Y8_9GAMM|nr:MULTISPECIES: flagellar hook protein FlgE [Thioalkalivibrio]AKJ95286.1 flagellar hook protein FlgE [Thioalkalivibrio versutus]
MPFNIGLSGLNAAQADLQTTGNNVSNSGTTGFKRSRAEFGDVFAQSFGGISQTAIGSGTRLQAVTQQFSQGRTEFTENGLDLAINGEGFFVLNDQGSTVYSRAGAFQVDRDGYLVNNQGLRLRGYDEAGGTNLGDLRLQTDTAAPQATSNLEALINLRSDAATLSDDPDDFVLDDPETYNFSTSLTMYDSLGIARDANLYFVKTAQNEWNAHVAVRRDDGNLEELANYGGGDSGPLGLEFDVNGQLVGVDPPAEGLTVPGGSLDGADDLVFDINFDGTTQFGGDFSVNDLNQDGFASGQLTGIDIDQTGVVFARFTNGQSSVLGQLALANFPNPQGLEQLGDNNWAETFAAGDVRLDRPGSSNLGSVQAGALEASNVDIAQELVNLITAQRNFQANAQTISTADQVTQTIINIR